MNGFRIFSVGDIPVHLSPFFLLILAFWVMGGDIAAGLIFGAVVTVSILVHELGHALVARHYRLQPSILLHGLGGLCFHQPAKTRRHEAFIIAAGPGAGLLLGCLTLAFLLMDIDLASTARGHKVQSMVITNLLYVNFFWSFVNLLPLYPLDGGQLFRLFMYRVARPVTADRVTHQVGLALAVLWGVLGWTMMGSMFMVILGGWLGLDNLRALQGGGAEAPAVQRDNPQAREMIEEAQRAFDAGDFKHAARVCHQLRSEGNLPDKVMSRLWLILGVSSARLGKHEEGLKYLGRAPSTAVSVEATIECLHMLDRADELKALLRSPDFKKVDQQRRAEIIDVLNAEREA